MILKDTFEKIEITDDIPGNLLISFLDRARTVVISEMDKLLESDAKHPFLAYQLMHVPMVKALPSEMEKRSFMAQRVVEPPFETKNQPFLEALDVIDGQIKYIRNSRIASSIFIPYNVCCNVISGTLEQPNAAI